MKRYPQCTVKQAINRKRDRNRMKNAWIKCHVITATLFTNATNTQTSNGYIRQQIDFKSP